MWTYLFKILLLALIGSFAQATDEDSLEICLKNGLEDYLRTGEKTKELNETLESLQLPLLFRTEEKGIISKAACLACDVGLGVIISARRNGAEKERIVGLLEKLCVWLKIESEPICHGAISIHAESIVYMVDNKEEVTSKRVCSILLQEHGCEDPNRKDWTIDIPKPTEISSNIRQEEKKTDSKLLKVLHLSDIHYDPEYEVGSDAACGSPLCCQKGSYPSTPKNAAGYWSDYQYCDTPWHMFTDALDHIVAQHKDLDMVYFTGDIINHKAWDTSIIENTKAITDVLKKLKERFGATPVYPILGNHEPHPVNLFSSDGINDPNYSTQWVFDLSAEEWKIWLPAETRDSILKGGYYTTLVKPGFRIIALNSNVCYTFNWWLFYDDVDQFGQLKWLVDVLLEAEKNGEVVHILSHIPSGQDNCLYTWNREYTKIVNRFAHIIIAQFNGHTHHDETLIYFNASNAEQAVNVAFNGGSLTTWAHVNPNYKVYTVDSENMEVLDFESWIFNVTEANLTPNQSPNWYKLYSFKNAYGVETLRPQELAKLTERMAKDSTLTELYFRYKYRDADTTLAGGCNAKCEKKNLCIMVTSHPEHTLHCEIITEIYNSARKKIIK